MHMTLHLHNYLEHGTLMLASIEFRPYRKANQVPRVAGCSFAKRGCLSFTPSESSVPGTHCVARECHEISRKALPKFVVHELCWHASLQRLQDEYGWVPLDFAGPQTSRLWTIDEGRSPWCLRSLFRVLYGCHPAFSPSVNPCYTGSEKVSIQSLKRRAGR